jgi:hypothetical protein
MGWRLELVETAADKRLKNLQENLLDNKDYAKLRR